MCLANGISFEYLLFTGLPVFLLINIGISLVEFIVFKALLKIPFSDIFYRLIIANCVSGLCGIFVYAFIESPLAWHFRSIEDCYRWSKLILIIVIFSYWAKSILIEGSILLKGKHNKYFEGDNLRLWKTVIYANILSYAIIGSVYYVQGQPLKTNLILEDSITKVTQSQEKIFFIDNDYICCIRADGTDRANIVKLPKYAMNDITYMVSENENGIIYRSFRDGFKYYSTKELKKHYLNYDNYTWNYWNYIDISPNGTKIALIEDHVLKIKSPSTNKTDIQQPLSLPAQWIYWMNDNQVIIRHADDQYQMFDLADRTICPIKPDEIKSPRSFQIPTNRRFGYIYSTKISESQNIVEVDGYYPFRRTLKASHQGKQQISLTYTDYGLLSLPLQAPQPPIIGFMDKPETVLFDISDDNLYIMDIKNNTFAKLTTGCKPVALNHNFKRDFKRNFIKD